jgi:hypothetical protein
VYLLPRDGCCNPCPQPVPCDTRDVIGSVPEFPTAETFRLDYRPLDVHPRFLTIFPFLPLPTAHAAYARRMLIMEKVPLAAITG